MPDKIITQSSTLEEHRRELGVCMLASGSKGNAVFITDGTTNILLDAGLSGVEIERRMTAVGLEASDLDAILVSHEHSDHIHGVGVLSRRYDLPVYLTNKTASAIGKNLGHLHDVCHFECGAPFQIGALQFRPFSTSHDAADPAGFTLTYRDFKLGIATDLGVATAMVKNHLKGCKALVVEANHDPVMLVKGPYPWPLKQRVKSRSGHLSNEDTGKLLKELSPHGLCRVILAHLSETNNTPEKAIQAVGMALNHTNIELSVALQNHPGRLHRFKA